MVQEVVGGHVSVFFKEQVGFCYSILVEAHVYQLQQRQKEQREANIHCL